MSPELLLTLDRRGGEPLRSQLEGQLRRAIRSGRLRGGERLPSSRELARELGLSRGLVQECYAQLQAEGYLSTRVGSATRVAAGAQVQSPPSPAVPGPAVPGVPGPAVPGGSGLAVPGGPGLAVPGGPGLVPGRPGPAVQGALREPLARVPAGRGGAQPLIADFLAGVPDLASFPRDDWLWALREACRDAPTAAFDYGDPRGSPVLREVLAAYLRRVRAADADPELMVICTGFAQGLRLALRALVEAGISRVAFEDPGYPISGAAAAAAAGAEAVPVPVDEDGVDVDALMATGARAAVLTPAHQSPTGVVLAPRRRLALARWAAEHDAAIIEDDYDAEYRYDREPVGALQGLAAGRVIALGTVSKSLAPGLRLGWMLCPPSLAGAIAEQKRLDDRGSPVLDQLALAKLIESGRYDRHLRRMRATYARRRGTLVNALARHAPGVRLTGLAAGFHAVAHLPEPMGEQAVIAAARDRRVGLHGMSRCRSTGVVTPPQLVLGFGNVGERAIAAGVAAVGDLLQPR